MVYIVCVCSHVHVAGARPRLDQLQERPHGLLHGGGQGRREAAPRRQGPHLRLHSRRFRREPNAGRGLGYS